MIFIRATLRLSAAALLLGIAACHTAPKPRPVVIAAPPACQDFTVSIYFEPESARMTREARAVVEAALRRARGCRVTGVRVLGLADAPGDPNANLALSKRRADAVAHTLDRMGLKTVAFQVAAAGDIGAQTGRGEAKPLRRRADVEFHVTSLASRS